MALFTVIPNDPLRDFVLPFPATLGSAWLEFLAPKENTLLTGAQ